MPCNCGKNKSIANQTFTVTTSSGSKKSFSSEIEAKAEAQRTGGVVRKS